MSFNNKNFSVMAYANGFTLWSYSTSDTLAVVKAENYFNDISPFAREGDMVLTIVNGGTTTSGTVLVVSKINNGVVSVASLTA